MTPERWQQICDLLEKAMSLAPEQRAVLLDRASVSDSNLRREVETLLASSDAVHSTFLATPATSRVALTPGTRLGGYELKSLIGAGGMGEVYRARDARLGRDVAIKVLPASLSANADRLRRFEQEARAAAALNHPNILAVYQMGTHDGSPYLVSELLEGETLREQLTRGRIIVRKAIDYGVQIGRGLSAAQEKGIVHRDLKPENLFVTKDGRVKILDFGLAKLTQLQTAELNTATIGGKTEPGVVLGTVGYMSPEQVQGEAADHRTDIFSFGAILYEMLAGHRAFQKPTSVETMVAILKEDPPTISQVRPGIPPALERVVHRCLEKNPEQRFQSPSDLAFALDALSEGSGYSSAPSTDVGANRHWPRTWLLFVLGTALLAGLIGWLRYRWSSAANAIGSVAVLPFAGLPSDPNSAFLQEGITEGVTEALSQMPNLKVISSNTVFRYKGRDEDPQQAGRDLKVDAILTGHMSELGDTVAVNAELVNVADGTRLWGQRYTEKAANITSLQREIASDIADKLRVKFSGSDEERLAKRTTENAEAYRLYLQGRRQMNLWNDTSWKKAAEYFQQAVDKDPNYSLAYAGLSDALGMLGYNMDLEPKDAYERARVSAERALILDPNSAEGYSALGAWNWMTHNFPKAESLYRRAIELNPNLALAHLYYSRYLESQGRFGEGEEQNRKAQELDPLSLQANSEEGDLHYYEGDFDGALVRHQRVLEIDPTYADAHGSISMDYFAKGMCDRAVQESILAADLTGPQELAAKIRKGYADAGCKGFLLARISMTTDPKRWDLYFPLTVASDYARLGDKEMALYWLDRCYEEGGGMNFVKVDAAFLSLRSDPRYSELLRKIGFMQ
jgi:eukaryotic-like serine/threonine-protein kinase